MSFFKYQVSSFQVIVYSGIYIIPLPYDKIDCWLRGNAWEATYVT